MNMRIIVLRIVFSMMIVLTCAVIFKFSSQNGKQSSKVSMGVVQKILDINKRKKTSKNDSENIEFIIRKIAHFSIYTSLGTWAICLMKTFFMKEEHKKQQIKQVSISFLFGFLYACSDEIHQLFSNGRSGQISDVIIDTIGVINGILLVFLILKLVDEKKSSEL